MADASAWSLSTYKHILGVLLLSGGDDSGSDHQFLPGLGEVKVVNAVLVALVNVRFHRLGAVLGSNVDLDNSRVR